MSPAGFTSETEALVLRPAAAKTFVKGVIAIAVFSVFLQINPSTVGNYLIFLALALGSSAAIALMKRTSVFTVDGDGIKVKRFMKAQSLVAYDNILDMSVAQGMLARRFNCGTVFFILKSGRGSVKVMGGGTAERLEDVPDPNGVYGFIANRLGPFSGR